MAERSSVGPRAPPTPLSPTTLCRKIVISLRSTKHNVKVARIFKYDNETSAQNDYSCNSSSSDSRFNTRDREREREKNNRFVVVKTVASVRCNYFHDSPRRLCDDGASEGQTLLSSSPPPCKRRAKGRNTKTKKKKNEKFYEKPCDRVREEISGVRRCEGIRPDDNILRIIGNVSISRSECLVNDVFIARIHAVISARYNYYCRSTRIYNFDRSC